MTTDLNRRSFVKTSLLSTAGLALALDTRGQTPSPLPLNPPTAPSGLPKGRIGKLEVSRILLGGNLLTHYIHSRDLRYVYNLAAHYNTDEKIMETLALAEKHGAIPPKDALQYAFQNGADFALAGMFDFEIAEDVKIASEVLAGVSQRARPWRA